MKREDGYYWVKLIEAWEPARWGNAHKFWLVIGDGETYRDHEFSDIGDKIIFPK